MRSKKVLAIARHLRREAAVGRQHGVARLVPADRRLRRLGQRRVAVPMVQRFHAEPFRLHRIVAVRQPRIGFAHGLGQRVDDAALDAVGEVAGIGDVLKAAPAVGDLLVLGQRVGDQREDADVLLEGRRQRFGGQPAGFGIGVLQAVQRRLQRQLLAVDVEAQVGHGLVEQAVPGAAPGDRLFVEQLLDAVFELVGLVHPEVEHPGPVVAEGGVGVERRTDQRVVDQIELQREKQQMRAGVRHLLLDVAVKLGALRVGRVAGIDERGIGDDAADQLFQRLVFAQALAEPGRRCPWPPRRRACPSSAFRRRANRRRPVRGRAPAPGRPWPDKGRKGSTPATRRARTRLGPCAGLAVRLRVSGISVTSNFDARPGAGATNRSPAFLKAYLEPCAKMIQTTIIRHRRFLKSQHDRSDSHCRRRSRAAPPARGRRHEIRP